MSASDALYITESTAPPVWSNEQQHQVSEESRLSHWANGQFKAIVKYHSVYERETEIVPVNWVGRVMTPRLADLVAPTMPEIEIIGTNQSVVKRQQAYIETLIDDLNLHAIIGPTARRVSWAGKAVWKLYWSAAAQRPAIRLWGEHEGEVAFEEIDPADPSTIRGYQFWYPVVVQNEKKAITYYVCERQVVANEQLTITNTAYKTRGGQPVQDTVPLESIWPSNSTAPLPFVQYPTIPTLLGYTIYNVCHTTDYSDDLLGIQKDYMLLLTQRQMVIRLLERPMLDVPSEYTNTDGTLKDGWQVTLLQNGEEAGQIKLSGWDGALVASSTQEEILRRQLYLHTPVSHVLLGDTIGANASGAAKNVDLQQSRVAVAQRRAFYPDAFRYLINACIALQNTPVPPIKMLDVEWPDIVEADTESEQRMEIAEKQELIAEYQAGVRSLESVLEHLHEDEQDVVAVELARLLPVPNPVPPPPAE